MSSAASSKSSIIIRRPTVGTFKTNDPYFKNQRTAQAKIIDCFQDPDLRYAILRADVQSGKSGVYHLLIQVMFELDMIDQAYIVCGSHEVTLLNQCKKDVETYHKNKVYTNKIYVIFRQNFSNQRMIMKRTLIIADETHLVQDADQTLNQFMQKHCLSMAGTTEKMIQDSIYILSVDATPFAEVASMVYGDSLPKGYVVLENGEGYYGPQHYYRDRLVHSTFDLSLTQNQERFKNLVTNQGKKYILIRTQKKNKQYNHMMSCIRRCNVQVCHYTSEFEKANAQIAITKEEAQKHYEDYHVQIPCLEEEPERTTVVLVDGRVRCGKRVCKNYIGFVWESSSSANTDTIIQSLFGRMCGYDVPLTNKPLIFIPERILKKPMRNKVIQASELERYFHNHSELILASSQNDTNSLPVLAPRYGTNILPGRVQEQAKRNNKIVTQCVPLRMELALSVLREDDAKIKAACLDKLEENNYRRIRNNLYFTSTQQEEMIAWLHSSRVIEEVRIRHYRGESNQNMHKRHVEAYQNGTASKEHISEYPFMTVCVTHQGFKPLENVQCRAGDVFVIFYTEAVGYVNTIDKESRISRHNGLSHFSIQASTEFTESPACSMYGFSPKIRESCSEFQEQFDHFILFGKKNIGIVGKRFVSIHNGEAILLPRSVYGNCLENLREMIESLETKHAIKITYGIKKTKPIGYSSNQLPVDHQLAWIQWE